MSERRDRRGRKIRAAKPPALTFGEAVARDAVISTTLVAEQTDLSPFTLRNAPPVGFPRGFRVGRRWRWRARAVAEYIARCEAASVEASADDAPQQAASCAT